MPNDIHSSDVSTAELWFHKKADAMDAHNQTFIISEVAHWDTNRSFQKTNPIAIQDTSIVGKSLTSISLFGLGEYLSKIFLLTRDQFT